MERSYLCLPRKTIGLGDYSLRAIQDSDIENIRCWRNEQMDILRQSAIITADQQNQYYMNHVWPEMATIYPKQILFSYFFKDVHIGYGGLVHIEWEHLRTEISFILEPSLTKDQSIYNQLFSSFLILIQEISFDHLNLERVFTETYAFRDYHISILEANGFQHEGVMRNHVRINNKPVDSIIHGCLKEYVR